MSCINTEQTDTFRQKIRHKSLIARAVFLFGLMLFSCLFLLMVLYLAKSAMGINLFPDFSLGIWQWFKGNVMMIMPGSFF